MRGGAGQTFQLGRSLTVRLKRVQPYSYCARKRALGRTLLALPASPPRSRAVASQCSAVTRKPLCGEPHFLHLRTVQRGLQLLRALHALHALHALLATSLRVSAIPCPGGGARLTAHTLAVRAPKRPPSSSEHRPQALHAALAARHTCAARVCCEGTLQLPFSGGPSRLHRPLRANSAQRARPCLRPQAFGYMNQHATSSVPPTQPQLLPWPFQAHATKSRRPCLLHVTSRT